MDFVVSIELSHCVRQRRQGLEAGAFDPWTTRRLLNAKTLCHTMAAMCTGLAVLIEAGMRTVGTVEVDISTERGRAD